MNLREIKENYSEWKWPELKWMCMRAVMYMNAWNKVIYDDFSVQSSVWQIYWIQNTHLHLPIQMSMWCVCVCVSVEKPVALSNNNITYRSEKFPFSFYFYSMTRLYLCICTLDTGIVRFILHFRMNVLGLHIGNSVYTILFCYTIKRVWNMLAHQLNNK